MLTKKEFIQVCESAYCWEGGSELSEVCVDSPTELVWRFQGVSTVEHEGDEDGIKSNVRRLVGQSFEDNGIIHTVNRITVSVNGGGWEEGDYEVRVVGRVFMTKKKSWLC